MNLPNDVLLSLRLEALRLSGGDVDKAQAAIDWLTSDTPADDVKMKKQILLDTQPSPAIIVG